MVYTEIQERNNKKYFYRVKSVRKEGKIGKKRIYLGENLSKQKLIVKEKEADYKLGMLNYLISDEDFSKLEKLKKKYKKQPKEMWENRYEAFCSKFTYDSNAIEGNSSTLLETSMILFDEIVPEGKTMREINELKNHKEALDFILSYKGEITKEFVLRLHKLVIKNTLRHDLRSQEGIYRKSRVFIRGAEFMPALPSRVPREMASLLSWHSKNKKILHPIVLAAYFHVGFETIHPFVDGNGRVGRLLINYILHKNGFPMINIPVKKRKEYFEHLRSGRKDNLESFVNFLVGLILEEEILL